jgi:hypothetical protein
MAASAGHQPDGRVTFPAARHGRDGGDARATGWRSARPHGILATQEVPHGRQDPEAAAEAQEAEAAEDPVGRSHRRDPGGTGRWRCRQVRRSRDTRSRLARPGGPMNMALPVASGGRAAAGAIDRIGVTCAWAPAAAPTSRPVTSRPACGSKPTSMSRLPSRSQPRRGPPSRQAAGPRQATPVPVLPGAYSAVPSAQRGHVAGPASKVGISSCQSPWTG